MNSIFRAGSVPALVVALFGSAITAQVATAQDTPRDGFALTALAYPGQATVATLSNGDVVAFDGFSVDRYDATGSLLQNLTAFANFKFGSFMLVDPSETFVVLGESSTQNLYRIELAGGGTTVLANLPNNYDAVRESATTIVVSAASSGFSADNEVWRVHTTTGVATLLATIVGPSGPVAMDAAGDLYYGTVGTSFPAPAGSSDILRFDAADLTGAPVLDASDATVFGAGFDGAGDLVCDAATGNVYLAENDFFDGSNIVFQVGPTRALSLAVVDGAIFNAIGGLEFSAGTSPAAFAPFQPAFGGTLRYTTTDFFSTFERTQVEPARPEVNLVGPGVSGPGVFSVQLSEAPKNGVAVFVFGVQSLYTPLELPFLFGGAPVFSGIDVGTAIIGPIVGTSASGTAQLNYTNDGTLGGTAVIQAICVDPLFGIVGSSTTAAL
ncbi:hypothetical protein Pla163_23460 [Planctomycetes bacterium Pla163]|uniref:SMP-30/Gluconolaconase/LRE-like region n=1 Tax=Rohdeia mirabilis TaxID=2528008 RepID=A0A518D152_9BACT|nr:hypothetical protein Pla163_23460 [Planctomycetes bacterium Pla163]